MKDCIGIIVVSWGIFSIFISGIMAIQNNCNKTYPINYIFYSRLFCEVGK